jgi:hypothetical protein
MGIPYNFHILNAKNCIIYIAFFMLAIFVSMPSKEFITFLVISLIPFVFNIKNKSDEFKIRLALFIIFCFGFYRAYYSLIPLFAVVMYLLSYIKIKKKTLKVVFLGVLTSIILSLGVGFYSGKFITQSTREQLNDFRKNSKDAQSMFISPIEADTWYGETVSIINGFFAVNIPIIEGVKHLLSPQIIVFVIWQLALFYILLVMLSKFIKQPKKNKFQLWALLILFSYYIVQGLFEPDLASAVRHKIGFFPLIYFIFYYNDFRKKIL